MNVYLHVIGLHPTKMKYTLIFIIRGIYNTNKKLMYKSKKNAFVSKKSKNNGIYEEDASGEECDVLID
jgi:hypothetical protein